jgi:hypothetical protein
MGRSPDLAPRGTEPMASAKAKRVDPAPRYLGQAPIFTLENANPNKKYVWVNQATPAEGQGREFYEIEGYVVEKYEQGGVKPRGIKPSPGDEIVVRGQWLMSLDVEDYRARVAYGQQQADLRDRQMIKRRGVFDPSRGMGNMNNRHGDPYVTLSETVSPLRAETVGGFDG